eukprot:5508406-Amphidinium_carterae.1
MATAVRKSTRHAAQQAFSDLTMRVARIIDPLERRAPPGRFALDDVDKMVDCRRGRVWIMR